MTLVIDASVACKWVLEEPDSELAKTLLLSGKKLIAPAIILAETANVFSRRSRMGEMSQAQASNALAGVRVMINYLEPLDTLIDVALDLSIRMSHPIYDCLYLALAQLRDCMMVTADKKLADRAIKTKLGKFVRVLTA